MSYLQTSQVKLLSTKHCCVYIRNQSYLPLDKMVFILFSYYYLSCVLYVLELLYSNTETLQLPCLLSYFAEKELLPFILHY